MQRKGREGGKWDHLNDPNKSLMEKWKEHVKMKKEIGRTNRTAEVFYLAVKYIPRLGIEFRGFSLFCFLLHIYHINKMIPAYRRIIYLNFCHLEFSFFLCTEPTLSFRTY